MLRLLKDLQKNEGFVGAFLFQANKGIVARGMPDDYENEDLIEMAQTVEQVCIASRPVFDSLKCLTYHYSKEALVIRVISTHQLLIAVTRMPYNYSKLIKGLDLLVKNLRHKTTKKTA